MSQLFSGKDNVSKALKHLLIAAKLPKACPYVMMRFLFVLSVNLISKDWFFAEGERFLSF